MKLLKQTIKGTKHNKTGSINLYSVRIKTQKGLAKYKVLVIHGDNKTRNVYFIIKKDALIFFDRLSHTGIKDAVYQLRMNISPTPYTDGDVVFFKKRYYSI